MSEMKCRCHAKVQAAAVPGVQLEGAPLEQPTHLI